MSLISWTSPKTWSVSEFVTASLLNTHVRDNLLFLKANPVIAETTLATTSDASGTIATILELTNVTIPADVGAVYCEAWAGNAGYLNPPGSGNFFSWIVQIYEATAGILHGYSSSVYASTTTDSSASYPYYARTRELAWAGSARTVRILVQSSNCTARLGASATSPIVLRIVRAY